MANATSQQRDNLVPFKGWGSLKAAAFYAGVNDPRTISNWIKDGLRCSRVSKKTILVRFTDIDEYLMQFMYDDASTDETINEILKDVC